MKVSGGGCQVPITGLYSIGAMMRIDQGVGGQSYFYLRIDVNGNVIGYSIKNNGSVGGVYYPYAYAQLWLPMPLKAGDIVTTLAYNWAGTSTVYGGWTRGPERGCVSFTNRPGPVSSENRVHRRRAARSGPVLLGLLARHDRPSRTWTD